jgi:hypothetical protein
MRFVMLGMCLDRKRVRAKENGENEDSREPRSQRDRRKPLMMRRKFQGLTRSINSRLHCPDIGMASTKFNS